MEQNCGYLLPSTDRRSPAAQFESAVQAQSFAQSSPALQFEQLSLDAGAAGGDCHGVDPDQLEYMKAIAVVFSSCKDHITVKSFAQLFTSGQKASREHYEQLLQRMEVRTSPQPLHSSVLTLMLCQQRQRIFVVLQWAVQHNSVQYLCHRTSNTWCGAAVLLACEGDTRPNGSTTWSRRAILCRRR